MLAFLTFFCEQRTVFKFNFVGSSDQVKVRFLDGGEAYGTVVRTDQMRDVALVQISPTGRTPIPIRTIPALVGEEVYAIGAPMEADLSGTVSRGIVSSLRRDKDDGQPYIQSDVSIHGGNSGGPLVDGQGNLIGISVAGMFMDATQRSAGLNLFIPIDDAFRNLSLRLAGADNWPGY